MTKARFFWLLSDNKTVREISAEEYFRKERQKKACQLIILHDTEITLVKGKRICWLPRKQLQQVLEA